MCSLESLKIDLKGLKEGETIFKYDLDNAYFEAVDGPEVRSGAVNVELSVQRTSEYFELNFHSEGTVNVPCDICLDDMEQPVSSDFIALSIPIKHVHAPGKCNPAMIKALEEHSAARSSDGDEERPVDPRWSELEKLKTIIKD